jgi:signal recognition particle receptor subunit beta
VSKLGAYGRCAYGWNKTVYIFGVITQTRLLRFIEIKRAVELRPE